MELFIHELKHINCCDICRTKNTKTAVISQRFPFVWLRSSYWFMWIQKMKYHMVFTIIQWTLLSGQKNTKRGYCWWKQYMLFDFFRMCFLTGHVCTGIGEVGERNWKSCDIIYLRITESGCLNTSTNSICISIVHYVRTLWTLNC
jgi:hypothetical protein